MDIPKKDVVDAIMYIGKINSNPATSMIVGEVPNIDATANIISPEALFYKFSLLPLELRRMIFKTALAQVKPRRILHWFFHIPGPGLL